MSALPLPAGQAPAPLRVRSAGPIASEAARRSARVAELPRGVPSISEGLPPAVLELLRGGPAKLLSRAALANNLEVVRSLAGPGVQVWPAIKADAYGHGLAPVAQALASLPEGTRPEGYGVARMDEALRLRDLGCRARLLVLAPPAGSVPVAAAAGGVEQVVASPEHLEACEAAVRSASGAWALGVHLKIDTGMGRVGCQPLEAVALARRIERSPLLRLRGVMTHFARADEPDDPEGVAATREQLESFKRCMESLWVWAAEDAPALAERFASGDVLWHAANSGAVCWHPGARLSMVRPGLMAYGMPPGPVRGPLKRLAPALTLAAPVLGVAGELPAWAERDAKGSAGPGPFARIGLGTMHGYSSRLAGAAEIVLGASRWRVVAVGPEQLWAEPSSPPREGSRPAPLPRAGDAAIAMGPPSSGAPSADDLAALSGTISYEITTALRAPAVAC